MWLSQLALKLDNFKNQLSYKTTALSESIYSETH